MSYINLTHCTKYLGAILVAGILPWTAAAQQTEMASRHAGEHANTVSTADATTTAPDEVVLRIGATKVTRSEIEAILDEQPTVSTKGRLNPASRRRLVESYVRMMVLSQQAVNERLDSSPALRLRLELQKDRLLAVAELEKIRSEIKVGPEQIAAYYASHEAEFDLVQIRQFLVRKRPKDSDSADVGMSAADANAKASSIREALESGESPEEVNEALGGPAVLLIDPRPRTLKRSEMIPALEKATFDAKDGGVAGPVDTPDAVLVALVLKHTHIEQKDAEADIANRLRSRELEAQLDDLKQKTGVWMKEDYFKSDSDAAAADSASQLPATTANPKP